MTSRLLQLLIDSFLQILLPGLLVTIPLTILSLSSGLSLPLEQLWYKLLTFLSSNN